MRSSNNQLYIHPDVEKVRSLHEPVLTRYTQDHTIYELLEAMAHNLYEAWERQDDRAEVEGRNFLRKEELAALDHEQGLTLPLCHEIMARQHGFRDWQEVKLAGRILPEEDFEQAVDAMIYGDLGTLEHLLDQKSHMILQRSSYPHKATLLHYVAANGVEVRRQIVPGNLPVITDMLIGRGAIPSARGYFYGEMLSTWDLLKTGTHLREAGIYDDIRKRLI